MLTVTQSAIFYNSNNVTIVHENVLAHFRHTKSACLNSMKKFSWMYQHEVYKRRQLKL